MKTYIHYGSKVYDPSRFKEIKNRWCPWNKPQHGTGLWASAVDAEYDWKDWCEDNNFGECIDDESFRFTLKDDTKVFTVKCEEDAKRLLSKTGKFYAYSASLFDGIDFEKLRDFGYDALEIFAGSNRTIYDLFYGWDCDSILILNKDVIVPV